MRKMVSFLICLILVYSFASCDKQPSVVTDTHGTMSSTIILSTMQKTEEVVSTYPQATVPVYTEESTAQETETNIQTEESTAPEKVYPPYEDKFTSFMEIPGREIFVNKRATIIPEERWNHAPPLAIFRVVGIEDEYIGYNTIYQIQFVDFYGEDNFDSEGVYTMVEMGHLDEQLYGRPPLEVGHLYARIWIYAIPGSIDDTLYTAGIVYSVEEENGKYYLYPYCTDLSHLECKIPITDPEENCPYKKGKHDKVIAYLNEHNIPLPTFDYKVEAGEYFAECRRRRP